MTKDHHNLTRPHVGDGASSASHGHAGTHKPDAANPLRLLFWESTSRCNLACIHCRRQDVAEAAAAEDLSTREAVRLFNSAALLGKPVIVFSGGEPLTRSDWPELAAHVRGLQLPCAMATNGTLITPVVADRVAASAFHRVSISLDGADAETHDEFRCLAGSFQRAVEGVRLLRERRVPVQINATIAAHNLHQLEQLYALARGLDACALHLFLLVPVGCGEHITESHQLSPHDYENVLEWVCQKQLELRREFLLPPDANSDARTACDSAHAASAAFELRTTCAPHYYRLAARHGLLQGNRSRGCLAGIGVIFVSHKGEVFPCGYLPVDCGNVRRTPLDKIWRDSTVLRELRDYSLLQGKCGQCEFRTVCGGCRARAYAQAHNYLAAEPFCDYQPGGR